MTIKERYQLWRIKPGMVFAAKLAEQQAWKHPNASMLGPEKNLMDFAISLGNRIADADDGQLTGLYLDATTHSRDQIGKNQCPHCGTELDTGFGLAGGGYGPYTYCPAETCGEYFDKTQEPRED